MRSIIQKKEIIKKHVYTNSELGRATTLHEFYIEHSFEREEIYQLVDLLVDDAVIQWTSEEQVISFPLPEWYKEQLEQMKALHLSALEQRQLF